MSFCSQNLLLTNMVCRGVGKVEGEDMVCRGVGKVLVEGEDIVCTDWIKLQFAIAIDY